MDNPGSKIEKLDTFHKAQTLETIYIMHLINYSKLLPSTGVSCVHLMIVINISVE